jgi:predicted amidohydrolase YtcJ
MRTWYGRASLLAPVSLAALVGACGAPDPAPPPAQRADLILHGGTVWTGAARSPSAEAVAVAGDRIVAVGANADVLALRGARTRIIDLRGAFVVPGFNDNHVHFQQAASFLEFNVMTVGSKDDFVARVKDVTSRLAPGEWIVGGYWGAYDQWAAGSAGGGARAAFAPDMRWIDALTGRHPMFIRRFDSAEFAANTAALEAVGIDPARPSAPDVEFLEGADGAFDGRLRGAGVEKLFAGAVPTKFSHERRLAQTRSALAVVRRHGVTSLSDMSDDEQLEIYRELRRAGELTVRVHFRPGLERAQELAAQGIKVGSGDEWIRLGAVKGHIDGIMGTSTARFFQPYSHDPANRGRWRKLMVDDKGELVPGQFLRYMEEADRAGIQMSVHAIGDEANSLLLDYLEELDRRVGPRDRRFRLVHAQVLAAKDFARLRARRIVAEVQPFHLADDMRWMEERIGKERCRGAYAFKSLQAGGAVLSFGTDWPGTSASEYPINPMLAIYAAVSRQTIAGQPAGGWFPEERIGIEDALRAYTAGTAYASFEENIKGTLEPGKLADIAVLSNNLLRVEPRAYLDSKVLYTIVGGRIVHDAAAKPQTN